MTQEHEAMDDMAEFGSRLNTSDNGYRLDTRRPFIPQGCDQQGRLTPSIATKPAEAATDLGFEDEDAPHVSGALVWPVYVVLAVIAVAAAWHFSGYLARFFVGVMG